MKVIDLLNKIANGEVDYEQQIKIDNEIINVSVLLGTYVFSKERFNDEVEIIEDKKIQKLREPLFQDDTLEYVKLIQSKINEIIEYLEDKQC